MHQTATEYLNAGLCVLPANRTVKAPWHGNHPMSWNAYEKRLPTKTEIDAWFANRHDALCLVAGKVSGNLEMIDFDHGGELLDPWMKHIPDELKAKLAIECTQSSGRHVMYRCADEVSGNMKLAQRKHTVTEDDEIVLVEGKECVRLLGKDYKIRTDEDGTRFAIITLIETRGEGGIFLCAPTAGYELLQGDLCDLPVITPEERDVLLMAAWELNEHVELVKPAPPVSTAVPNEMRPGDDFNARGDIAPILQKHGWTYVRMLKDNQMWRRPGKTKSWSASYNGTVFYVWTPNAPPLEQQRGYNRFAVYGYLEHNGNWSAAASELRKQGFGGDDTRGNLEGVNIDGILQQGQHEAAENDPDEFKLSEMLTNWPTEAEPVIDGWLRRGEVGNLIGGPKTYKTWMLQQCIVSVLEGKPVFGNASIKGRVLLVDYELAKGTLSKRLYNVAHAMETSVKAIDDNLTVLAKRGKAFDLDAMERYVDSRGLQFDLIAVDPLFRLFPQGMDENSNADVAALYGRLINLAERAQSALLVVHHMSKGSQADKAVTDLGAGAGSQSRACDLHLTLRQHEEDDCAVVAGVVRSFKPFKPFCLRYEWPIWQDAPELDPDSLARPGKRKKEPEPIVPPAENKPHHWTPEEFVEAFVTALPASKDVIFLKANQAGIRDNVASKLLNAAEDMGLIFRCHNPDDKRRVLFANRPVEIEPEPQEAPPAEVEDISTSPLNEAELHVRLAESRKRAGLSIRDAADALGIAKSSIAYWEQGNEDGRSIPPERIEQVEEWLKSIGGYGTWNAGN